MASVTARKGKYGTVYRAQVYVKGRRETGTFDKKSEAWEWAEETEALLRAGKPLPDEIPDDDMDIPDDISDYDMDIEEALDKYVDSVSHHKKENTRRMDREIKGRLAKYFQGRTLKDISPKDIASYRDMRLKKVGGSSIRQDMSFLSCLYEQARMEWGLSVPNPVKDVKRPKPPKNRERILSQEEIKRFLGEAKKNRSRKFYPYVQFLLLTAMRPSEAAGLTWSQILWDQRLADLTVTKTEPRKVPLVQPAIDILKAIYDKGKDEGEYIFLPNDGKEKKRRVLSQHFRSAFETVCRKAKIKNFTMYGFRHTAGSYLLMRGVDIRTVADIMGHRNISQTQKYVHLIDDHKMESIDKAFGDWLQE